MFEWLKKIIFNDGINSLKKGIKKCEEVIENLKVENLQLQKRNLYLKKKIEVDEKTLNFKKEQKSFKEEKEHFLRLYSQFSKVKQYSIDLEKEKTILEKKQIELENEKKLFEKKQKNFEKRKNLLDFKTLIEGEFEYEQRKARLQENNHRLKREEKYLRDELKHLNREKIKLIDENIRYQRLIYLDTEKNEQLLFIIRSIRRMNPLYESIIYEMMSTIRNESVRNIVSDYLMGKSFYEIADLEGKSVIAVQRTFFLAVNALKKRYIRN